MECRRNKVNPSGSKSTCLADPMLLTPVIDVRVKHTMLLLCCVIFMFASGMLEEAFFSDLIDSPAPLAFDAGKWRTGGNKLRECMAEDIKQNHRLHGLHRQQVIELLGPEDGCHIEQRPESLTYNLGPYLFDTLWLTIEFKNEQVESCLIWVD